jgi:hypothetical protein
MWLVVEVVGMAAAAAMALLVLSVLVALAVAGRVRRGRGAPLKRFSVFVLDFLYLPLKMLFGLFGRTSRLDERMVALRNRVNREPFIHSSRRLLLAPQCLRDLECPAPSTRRGILCKECGRCTVGDIAAEARRLGYQLYLLTGSAFIPTLVAEERPDAALLVACPYECNKVMMALGGLTTYAVPLTRDGCVGTDVDISLVVEAMHLGRPAAQAENPQPGGGS